MKSILTTVILGLFLCGNSHSAENVSKLPSSEGSTVGSNANKPGTIGGSGSKPHSGTPGHMPGWDATSPPQGQPGNPGTPQACPEIAKVCKDGSIAKRTGRGCEVTCGDDTAGPGDGLACPAIARVCKNGNTAIRKGNGCATFCPEDRPALACPQIARICQNGSIAKYVNPQRSCALYCPEDYTSGNRPGKGNGKRSSTPAK